MKKDDPFLLAVKKSGNKDFEMAVKKMTSEPEVKTDHKVGQTEAAVRGAAQGLTFNFADELIAGLKSLTDDKSYEDHKKAYRERDKAAENQWPKTYFSGDIAGSLIVPIPGLSALKGASKAAKISGKSKSILQKIARTKPAKSLSKYKSDIASGAASEVGKAEDKNISDAAEGAVSGYLFGKIANTAVKKINKNTIKDFTTNTLRIMLTGGDRDKVNHNIREYLQRSDQINKSMSREEIADKINLVYEHLDKSARKLKQDFDLSSKKLDDEVILANKSLDQTKREAQKALSESRKKLSDIDPPDISSDINEAVKTLRKDAGKLSSEAFKLLPENEKISSEILKDPVKKRINALNISGKPPALKEAKSESDSLKSLLDELDQTGDLSLPEAFKFRKQLDHLGKGSSGIYNRDASGTIPGGEREKVRAQILSNLRQRLKEGGGPEYRNKMNESYKRLDLLDLIRDKKILPKGLDPNDIRRENLTKFSGSLHKNPENKNILDLIDKLSGSEISNTLKPYFDAQNFLTKGVKPEKISDKTLPELQDFLKKSEESEKLKKYVKSRSSDLISDKKPGQKDFLRLFGSGDIDEILKEYARSKKLSDEASDELKKAVSPQHSQHFVQKNIRRDPTDPLRYDHKILDKTSRKYQEITGMATDLSRSLKDRQTFESFLKQYTNGSKRTLFFSYLLAPAGQIGQAAGAALGFTIDTEGTTMLKKALDGIIKLKRDPTIRELSDRLYPVLKKVKSRAERANLGYGMNQATGRENNE